MPPGTGDDVNDTVDRRTGPARISAGAVAVAMGAVSIAVNVPYTTTGPDRMMAWAAIGCAGVGACLGLWLLTGPAPRGRRLVLTRSRTRIGFAAGMTVVWILLLGGQPDA